MIQSILNFLLLVVPVVIEYFENKRKENESPLGYVKRKQEEELKTYEAIAKNDGGQISRIRQLRLDIIAERLRRMQSQSNQPIHGVPRIHSEGTRLRNDPRSDGTLHTPARNDD